MNTWVIILLSIFVLFLLTIILYRQFFKRFWDIVLSGLAIVILSPLFLIVAVLVRVNIGSPIIFKQERPGYKGKIFNMYKFRSMLPPQTRDGRKLTDNERLECVVKGIEVLSDEERLTKFGRILRATSLDELPELWNIFIGDMSIVGPRPLATIYLPYYTKEEMRRHDVRPGLTGWAQVHGRNEIAWEKRFQYDIYYVDHCSFILDMKTIFQTVVVVLKHDGIGQGEAAPGSFSEIRQQEWNEGKVIKDR